MRPIGRIAVATDVSAAEWPRPLMPRCLQIGQYLVAQKRTCLVRRLQAICFRFADSHIVLKSYQWCGESEGRLNQI